MRRLLFVLFVLLGAPAFAQTTTVLNPSTVIFTASPDHNATIGGTAVVSNYVLEVYDGTTLVRSTDLGKPTPNASNDISAPLTNAGLAKNKVYTAFVVAVGPGGSARSATGSSPFAWPDAPRPASNLRVQ